MTWINTEFVSIKVFAEGLTLEVSLLILETGYKPRSEFQYRYHTLTNFYSI